VDRRDGAAHEETGRASRFGAQRARRLHDLRRVQLRRSVPRYRAKLVKDGGNVHLDPHRARFRRDRGRRRTDQGKERRSHARRPETSRAARSRKPRTDALARFAGIGNPRSGPGDIHSSAQVAPNPKTTRHGQAHARGRSRRYIRAIFGRMGEEVGRKKRVARVVPPGVRGRFFFFPPRDRRGVNFQRKRRISPRRERGDRRARGRGGPKGGHPLSRKLLSSSEGHGPPALRGTFHRAARFLIEGGAIRFQFGRGHRGRMREGEIARAEVRGWPSSPRGLRIKDRAQGHGASSSRRTTFCEPDRGHRGPEGAPDR